MYFGLSTVLKGVKNICFVQAERFDVDPPFSSPPWRKPFTSCNALKDTGDVKLRHLNRAEKFLVYVICVSYFNTAS